MSLLNKNRRYFINDPLKFMKDSIEWNAFPPLLSDLCQNYTDVEIRPNIPMMSMDRYRLSYLDSL
ncbi:MAG: hypothetical protein QW292_07230 [Candidatus Parvarchaeota archaeon]